jgi:hypothetical protein
VLFARWGKVGGRHRGLRENATLVRRDARARSERDQANREKDAERDQGCLGGGALSCDGAGGVESKPAPRWMFGSDDAFLTVKDVRPETFRSRASPVCTVCAVWLFCPARAPSDKRPRASFRRYFTAETNYSFSFCLHAYACVGVASTAPTAGAVVVVEVSTAVSGVVSVAGVVAVFPFAPPFGARFPSAKN